MRNPGGYSHAVGPDEATVRFTPGGPWEHLSHGRLERDSFTCAHCGEVEHPPIRLGPNDIGFCRYCYKRICQKCTDHPCVPLEKRLEALENGIKEALERTFFVESIRPPR